MTPAQLLSHLEKVHGGMQAALVSLSRVWQEAILVVKIP